MPITVNGQSYPDWASIPADLRDRLAAHQPDSDGSGVPDAFEGDGTVTATVDGDSVSVSTSSTSHTSTSSTNVTIGGHDVTDQAKSWWKKLLGR